MMSVEEYARWIASRKGKGNKVKTVKIPKVKPVMVPQVPFRDWVIEQTGRADSVGDLARDIVGEERRIGRVLTALNSRVDLMFFCDGAPKSSKLNREIGLNAWKEWLRVGQEKETQRENVYDI
jgi:hypothetical protein